MEGDLQDEPLIRELDFKEAKCNRVCPEDSEVGLSFSHQIVGAVMKVSPTSSVQFADQL